MKRNKSKCSRDICSCTQMSSHCVLHLHSVCHVMDQHNESTGSIVHLVLTGNSLLLERIALIWEIGFWDIYIMFAQSCIGISLCLTELQWAHTEHIRNRYGRMQGSYWQFLAHKWLPPALISLFFLSHVFMLSHKHMILQQSTSLKAVNASILHSYLIWYILYCK